MRVKDRIIVITGGGNGIGAAMARRFRRDGAKAVIVGDLDGASARAVADEIGGHAVTLDVADPAAVAALVDRTEHEIGPIDLFCSNAGILDQSDLQTSDEAWQRAWAVNVMAHVHAARAVVPRMIARGGGYLLNTASAAGLLNQIGSATYGVTKHAAIGFGEWVAMTHAHQGIKVSMLCPQAVDTAMARGASAFARAAAVDGVLDPDDVAEAVVEGLQHERFLILPHPQVRDYMRRKAQDYDRWIAGMNRLHRKLDP